MNNESLNQKLTDKYNAGITAGQNNVKGNPNSYGLYTGVQYLANYTTGYNNGVAAGRMYVGLTSTGYCITSTYNIASINPQNHKKLTSDNFLLVLNPSNIFMNDGSGGHYVAVRGTTPSKSYDPYNGILTVNTGGLFYDCSDPKYSQKIGLGSYSIYLIQ